MYQQIQQIIMDEVPTFYAWYRPFLHVISKEFTGYTDSISYGGLFHMLEDFTVAE
jgi:ABC-type transport system substrate-binding protein